QPYPCTSHCHNLLSVHLTTKPENRRIVQRGCVDMGVRPAFFDFKLVKLADPTHKFCFYAVIEIESDQVCTTPLISASNESQVVIPRYPLHLMQHEVRWRIPEWDVATDVEIGIICTDAMKFIGLHRVVP